MKLIDKYDVKSITNIQENKQVLTTSTSAQINPEVTSTTKCRNSQTHVKKCYVKSEDKYQVKLAHKYDTENFDKHSATFVRISVAQPRYQLRTISDPDECKKNDQEAETNMI